MGGMGVSVGGMGVSVGGMGVLVGGMEVLVGGISVLVDGMRVFVAGIRVLVAGMGMSVVASCGVSSCGVSSCGFALVLGVLVIGNGAAVGVVVGRLVVSVLQVLSLYSLVSDCCRYTEQRKSFIIFSVVYAQLDSKIVLNENIHTISNNRRIFVP